MKKLITVFAVLFALALRDAVSADKPDGKKLYEAKCAMCHAKDGKGSKAMAGALKVQLSQLDLTDTETSKKSDCELKVTILNGKGKMPAYKGKLTDAEIDALVSYIRELQKKK